MTASKNASADLATKNPPETEILWLGAETTGQSSIELLNSSGGFRVTRTLFAGDLFASIEKRPYQTLIIDFTHWPEAAEQKIEQLREILVPKRIPALFIIARNQPHSIVLLNSFIEFDIIYAPFEYAELHWRLQRLLEINGLREENEVNVQTLGNYERQLARLNDFLAYSLPAFAPYASDADEQIFKHIGMFLRQLSDGLGAENTVLLRFSAEQKELILEATRVEPEADKHKCVFQFDDPFLAPTAQNFEISHWSSAADATPTESATFLEELSAALSRDIHSLILVPILLEQRLYGIIAVINKVTATTFAPLDISFAQISVNFFAKELQRAQLFRSASKDGRVDDLASPFITHINNKLEFLHSILDSVMFGVIVLNHYNQIIYMNNAAERILERRFADLKDENFADIFGPDVLSENFFNHERDTRDVLRYEVELTMADGEPKLIGFASQVHKIL
jgi:PAS domain-containing protein